MKTKEILMILCLVLLGIALIASLFKKVPGIVKNGSFFIAIVLLAVSQVLGETNEPLIQKTDTNAPVLYTKTTKTDRKTSTGLTEWLGIGTSYTNRSSGSYTPFVKTDKKGSFGFGLRETDYCFPSNPGEGGDPNYNSFPDYKCGETDINNITKNKPKWDDKNNVWETGPSQWLPRPRNTDAHLDKHSKVKGVYLNWDKICMTPCCRSQLAFCCGVAIDSAAAVQCVKDRGCDVDINGVPLDMETMIETCYNFK